MKRGRLSSTMPLASGITATAYLEAAARPSNASRAPPARSRTPPSSTGFTAPFSTCSVASSAARRLSGLVCRTGSE